MHEARKRNPAVIPNKRSIPTLEQLLLFFLGKIDSISLINQTADLFELPVGQLRV
jgi:hypothetical protein